jgi:hypothetical protein
MTVDLKAEELRTYQRFQLALLRKTGRPFRYLPVEPQAAPLQASHASQSGTAAAAWQESFEDQARGTLLTGSGPPIPALASAPASYCGTLNDESIRV